MWANGTNADGLLGSWDKYAAGGSFKIHSTLESLIGVHSTVLRGCTTQNELVELGLKLTVLANKGPAFETELQTSFEPIVGEVLVYYLPKLVDPEGNDLPEVYIDY